MRVDQLLNKLCIIKTRNIANKACHKNLILINGNKAKAASTVNEGDIISISLNGFKTEIKLTTIPKGNVSKKNALDYYEIISRNSINDDFNEFED